MGGTVIDFDRPLHEGTCMALALSPYKHFGITGTGSLGLGLTRSRGPGEASFFFLPGVSME